MRAMTLAVCGLTGAVVVGGCKSESEPKATPSPVAAGTTAPADAIPARPGLKVGDAAPAASFTDPDGKVVTLASLYGDQPVLVTFYRGVWCPYCNKALAGWEERLPELKAAGARVVAVSPETPENARKTIEKGHLTYEVLIDGDHSAAKAFNLNFSVDDATKEKYKGYGIDLAAANVSGTWDLPAPGTFLIVSDGRGGGVIKYAFAEWDYKTRANLDEVLAAVKAATGK